MTVQKKRGGDKLKVADSFAGENKNKNDLITQMNFAYLSTAKQLVQYDEDQSAILLGVDKDLIQRIKNLTQAEMMSMAYSGVLLCQLRLNDALVVNAFTNQRRDEGVNALHAAILMLNEPLKGLKSQAA